MRITAVMLLLLLSQHAASQDRTTQAASDVARVESLILQYRQMQATQSYGYPAAAQLILADPAPTVSALSLEAQEELEDLRSENRALRAEVEELRRRCR